MPRRNYDKNSLARPLFGTLLIAAFGLDTRSLTRDAVTRLSLLGAMASSNSRVNSSYSRSDRISRADSSQIVPLEGQTIDKTDVKLVFTDSLWMFICVYSSSIILIPGLGTPGVELWSIRSPAWTDLISKTASRPRLLTFEYNIPLDDHFSWQLLFLKAALLLDSLFELCTESEVKWITNTHFHALNTN